MDLETFKAVYRDLMEMHFFPTLNYCFEESGKNKFISGTSLGSLRNSDFEHWGLETKEQHNKELEKAGFNEESFREKLRAAS